MIRLFGITLLSVVLILGLSACGKSGNSGDKVLRVGAETTFPPFEYQEQGSSEYTGFDMDLIRAIAKELGLSVEIKSMQFDGLIPALQAGNIDAIISAVTITDERKAKVDFSDPYYNSGLAIVVPRDNTAVKSFKDLEGKKLAVQIGTTSASEAKKIKNAVVREFNSTSDAYLELKAGGADAVINDLPVSQDFLNKGGNAYAKLVGEILNSEQYGIAVKKDNADLLKKINTGLAALRKNGEYDKLYVKWFGTKP